MIIKTPEDWWANYAVLVEKIKGDDGVLDDVPARAIVANLDKLSLPQPELREFWAAQGDRSVFEVLDKLAVDRDHRNAWQVLQAIWEDLPDRSDTRSLPGFFNLCDACSEIWVFEEDDG